MAPSCSSTAPGPLQTDLSLTLDENVDKIEGLFKLFYSRFMESKNKTQEFIYMEKIKGVTFLQPHYWLFISPSGILLFKR